MAVEASARAAVFLDRDGVLNLDKGYVHRVEDLVLLPGVGDAVAALKKLGYLLCVVSNQSGVARGLYTEADVKKFNDALNAALRNGSGGTGVDAFYVCPHHPDAAVAAYKKDCDCRKPKAGLIERAVKEHNVDVTRSYMVGDRPDDVEAALAAGVTPVQVTTTGFPKHPGAIAHVGSLKDLLPLLRVRNPAAAP